MAAKIKDGLFVGDEDTSMSEVFINDNKISNLINLSGMENLFICMFCKLSLYKYLFFVYL